MLNYLSLEEEINTEEKKTTKENTTTTELEKINGKLSRNSKPI